MSRRCRLPSSADEIYSHSLRTLHEGRALWYPEPHDSGEPQIGDVGYILRGAFIRLLNIDTSAPEKRVTFWPTPFEEFEDIEPLPPNALQVDRRLRPLVPKVYRSYGVDKKQMHASADIRVRPGIAATLSAEYTCHVQQGAVLELRREALAQTLFRNLDVEQYVLRNHAKWYAYARNVLRHPVHTRDIVLVVGWVKTGRDWAAAAFSNRRTSSSVAFGAHAGGVAGGDLGAMRASSVASPEMERQGQGYLLSGNSVAAGHTTRDRCIFIKRYKLRRRFVLPAKIVAGPGPHQMPGPGEGGSSGEGGVAISDEFDDDNVSDPLDVLLDYILETTAAKYAVTSDDVLASIVHHAEVVDIASFLRSARPHVRVVGEVGTITIEDVLIQRQRHTFEDFSLRVMDKEQWPHLTLQHRSTLSDVTITADPPGRNNSKVSQLKVASFMGYPEPSKPFTAVAVHAGADYALLAAALWETHSLPVLSHPTPDDGEKRRAVPLTMSHVLVWRLSDGILVREVISMIESKARALAFSPDGDHIVLGSEGGSAGVWSTRYGSGLAQPGQHSGAVFAVAYSPDGLRIATVSTDIQIWNSAHDAHPPHERGTCLYTVPVPGVASLDTFAVGAPHIFVRQRHGGFICNFQTGQVVAQTEDPEQPFREWLASPQRGRIAVLSTTGDIAIWSATSGERLLRMEAAKIQWMLLAWSPDGDELAVAGADCAVFYDTRTGVLRRVFDIPGRYAGCVAYSPDGAYVALGTLDGNVSVYDRHSGEFLVRFIGDLVASEKQQACFLPDSRNILFYSDQRHPRLLNVHHAVQLR